MPKHSKPFPIELLLGGQLGVETPQGRANCTITQVNRSNLRARGDGLKIKIQRNGEEEPVVIRIEAEDAQGRKLLHD